MAIIPIIKINIISLKKHEKRILDWLQDAGVAQIELTREADDDTGEGAESKDNDSAGSEIDYDLAGIDFALKYLNSHKPEEKKTLWEKLAPDKIRASKEKIKKLAKDFDFRKLTEQVQNIENDINKEKNETLKLKGEKKVLRPWQKFETAQDETETKSTKTISGMVGLGDKDGLVHELDKQVKESQFETISQDEKNCYFKIYYKKNGENALGETLNKHKVEMVELPYSEMTASEALSKVEAGIKNSESKLLELEKKTTDLAKDYKKLQVVYDFLTWEKEKQEAREKFLATEKVFMAEAWVEKEKREEIDKALLKLTKNNVLIRELEMPKNPEEVPVVIRNHAALSPFESVTGIYGMPKTNEIDPTPFLAPFFILFFAICLSDAGYGIILALFSLVAIKVMKVPRENQKLFRLLIYGGIVTFIVGVLFGGWFGIELDKLGDGWIKSLLLTFKIVDPIKNPIAIMLLAFALGILQVLTGIGVKMLWQFRQKNYWAGILDSGLWIVFIISLLTWVLNGQVIHSDSLGSIFKWVTLILMAGLILTQGRTEKNPLLKLGSGVMSLYGLVGYLSDVLSYSRLLALGLATGIIALVVNLIALILKDMMPGVIGWIIAILILIGGHLFNLAINALGSFIHSGRLQFVEFFPKFMEGGGSRFRPLKRESKYVEVTK